MGGDVDFHETLLAEIASGRIADKAQLQRRKIQLCRELHMETLPPNSETLARASDELKPLVREVLRRKPVRTLSGVAVVATMTSPAPCPHGRCTYCPGGVENASPQSYTGKEPAARRAISNHFEPRTQTAKRMEQLEAIGHSTDKIDLIIMGGTFTSRPLDYQEWYVKGCFDAMNESESACLVEAQAINETAPHRCIGLTIETRPDSFDGAMADHCMSLGATRVEFGVQVLDDDILRGVSRGHGVKEVETATRVAKEKGLKVCYHLMPGLPGASPQKDLESFRAVFEDERFRPDMLKIYPTLVVKGTPLYESWRRGEYSPYDTEKATEVVAEMKALTPKWARIQRIQRDIPVQLIEAGVDKSHLRELAKARLKAQGKKCNCIRCREVGLNRVPPSRLKDAQLTTTGYRASGGEERFIALELPDELLVGYARLRINSNGIEAHLRELKIFGLVAEIGKGGGEWQHRGLGKKLVAEAERQAAEVGCDEIMVTSGVGVRRYYEPLGYSRDGAYMAKPLGAT
ncbi:MAG TPA: tRNA uridine(34) 5-carboxymethylaminomethyl modification radical SAM/GNAT enzyme Elp3 [Methanomassiliicoccales archaeon]|nr:tRNA uridine(34) 5-carboxymethylaminomethyl modification radical SAM/GNAT enzyme Elp3 [Methanomassiliicoccales archaeon]